MKLHLLLAILLIHGLMPLMGQNKDAGVPEWSKMKSEIPDGSFDSWLRDHPDVVLIYFTAEWCGPCRMVKPVVEEINKDYRERLSVLSVDVDDSPEVPTKYGIRAIPTLLIFKKSEVVDKVVGTTSKKALEQKLKAALE